MFGMTFGKMGALRTSGGQFVLDQIAAATAAAYSTRRLSGTYYGPALRVRRSSDSVEADIGFNADGTLNETALLAHVGANSGFVSKYYDQSGNGRDMAQATAASQPRIVNAGVVDRIAGTTTVGSPELVTNGTFDVDTTGWAVVSGTTLSVVSGAMRITNNVAGVGQGTTQSIPTVAGKTYTYSLIVITNSSGKGYSLNIGANPAIDLGSVGTHSGNFTATTANTNFAITTNSVAAVGEFFDIDNVSIKEVTAVNKPAMSTDGVAQTIQSPVFDVAQPFTRASTMQFLDVTVASAGFFGDANDQLYQGGDGTLHMVAGLNVTIKTGISTNDTASVVEVYNGASSLGEYNRAQTAGNSGALSLHNGFSIGSNGTHFAKALFGDVILFPIALDPTTRTALEQNQKQFWGTP